MFTVCKHQSVYRIGMCQSNVSYGFRINLDPITRCEFLQASVEGVLPYMCIYLYLKAHLS